MKGKTVKKVIDILDSLAIDNDRLTADERDAISEARKVIELYHRKKDEDIDFQGWTLRHHTMKDLREFMEDSKGLSDDCKILVLQDDGMGYGANNGYCTALYRSRNLEGKEEIQVWF